MQIKPNYLEQHLKKKSFSIYWLAGQDTYLIENSLKIIKTYIKSLQDCDETLITIQAPEDWTAMQEEANAYSLFSEATLLNIVYDKKTLDSTGKKIISEYLKNSNSRCFIIIRSPNIPAKQLQWLTPLTELLLVIHYPLTADAMNTWIASQLKINKLSFGGNVPALIQQHTQGNMLACAQVIEKISLTYAAQSHISNEQVLEQVFNQCEHSLFELIDTCLIGQADKGIQILRHAATNKTEATLVLWMFTQELRLLLQLNYLIAQNVDFKSACGQLKIWPQRTGLYQAALKRTNQVQLQELIHYCLNIDEQIKSSSSTQVWNSLERIALSLCLGPKAGILCIL
jgi:DNA polymerase-3 subunit delta